MAADAYKSSLAEQHVYAQLTNTHTAANPSLKPRKKMAAAIAPGSGGDAFVAVLSSPT